MKLAIASTFRPDVIPDDAIVVSDPLVGATSYTPASNARPFDSSAIAEFVALDDGAPASSREDASLYRSLLTGHAVRVCWGKVAA